MNNDVLDILAQIPIFSSLERKELLIVADMDKSYATYTPGTTIMQQGDQTNDFLILLEGELSILRDNTEINVVRPPDFVGEVGFICREPRTASVIAITESIVLRLTRETFDTLPISVQNRMQSQIIAGLVNRITNINSALANAISSASLQSF